MAKRTPRGRSKPASTAVGNQTRNLIIGSIAGVAIIGLGVLLYLSVRGPGSIRDLITVAGLERGHDNTVEADDSGLPPVGGLHHDVWQNCGIYDEPINAGNAVHSMEHGAVWITYQPDLPDNDVEYLQNLVRGEGYLLLSPYPDLKSPVVLSAWGLQLEVDSVRDNRIEEFIDRYQAGPQTPERGATCQDGVGQPLP